MRCPFCAHEDSQVKDSRPSEDGASIRRRRECAGCGARFTTFERVQLRDLTVLKKDGKREPFDRAKLERAIGHACRKRAIESGKIEQMASGIQRRLETSGDEVTTDMIGQLVMFGLKSLDPVAYIRFASVYKDFTEAGDFAEIAEAVEGAPTPPEGPGLLDKLDLALAFYAYLLRCSNGAYYAGHTDDLDARYGAHQSDAMGGYTSRYRPVELVWSQDFPDRESALDAERQIKGWSRAKKEALIRGDWDAMHLLAMRTPILRDTSSSRSARSAVPQDQRIHTNPVRPEEGLSREAVEGPSRRIGPIIILVRPQLGQNIGKAARAMLNFGLTELRLVTPRDGWPNPEAGPAASGADIVLEQATVHATVADAVADCTAVFASTVRRRDLVLPVVSPAEMAAEIHASVGRTAILFGPERSGLETEDVALAGKIVTVPINPEFGSLNLAQAVILLAYEWSRSLLLAQPTWRDTEPPAPQADVEGLVGQMDEALAASGYYFPADRTEVTRLNLRTMLTKPGWSAREIRAMRGMLRAIAKGQKR